MKTLLLTFVCIFSLQLMAQNNFEAMYEKYAGKIIFSNEEIKISTYDDAKIKNQFNLTESIHAHAFLNKTLETAYVEKDMLYDFNREKNEFNYAIRAIINEDQTATWYYEMPIEDYKYRVNFPFVLTTNQDVAQHHFSEMINQWAKVIGELGVGKHNITIQFVMVNQMLIGDELPVLAEGNLELSIKKEMYDVFLNEHTTSLPPATMRDTTLELEITEASKNDVAYAIPLYSIITDKNGDWHHLLDEFGNVSTRYIIASTVYKYTEDKTCWVKTARYSQEHQGNGNFGPTVFDYEVQGYYDYKIPCGRVE